MSEPLPVAGVVWFDSRIWIYTGMQLDPFVEQWLQAHSRSLLLWLGHHVAGFEILISRGLLSGVPQPDSAHLSLLGEGLPSRLL